MRILAIKLSSIGDIFHALPAVAALKAELSAEIHWAVQPEFAGIVECFTCVDRAIRIPRRGPLKARLAALKALRAERYDMAIDFQGLLKSAVVCRAARARLRIGPSFHREGSILLYDSVAGKADKGRHAIEECMDVLDCLKIARPSRPQFPIAFPDMSALVAGDSSAPHYAMAPMSRWTTKNWPIEHFAEVARRLAVERGAVVHIIGGKGERDAAQEIISKAAVSEDAPQIVDHCGKLSLPESGGLLKLMRALVCNDSGPMHIAAALGVPCVVPFGPTIPGRTGPYGAIHRVIQHLDVCEPCRCRECSRNAPGLSAECMALRSIAPDEVMAAIP